MIYLKMLKWVPILGMIATASATYQPADRTALTTKINACISDTGNWDDTVTDCADVENWDVSLITEMQELFEDKENFNEDISGWDVSSVTTMQRIFEDADSFNQDISGWDVSSVVDMLFAFHNAEDFNQDISAWDVSSATNLAAMFDGAVAFDEDISGWDVSSVTNLYAMFRGATGFNQNLSPWDVGEATDMRQMFKDASAFDQELCGQTWIDSTASTTDMFKDAGTNAKIATEVCVVYDSTTLKTQVDACITDSGNWDDTDATCADVENWDVSNVTSMENLFENKANFNEDISGWDVSSVTTMQKMFMDADSFNQDISSWDVSNVWMMNYMFFGADDFNQDISSWDLSGATHLVKMFYDAESFNQDISTWNVSGVKFFTSMFQEAEVFNQDLSAWDVGSATYFNNMFNGATAFDQELCGQTWIDSTASTTDMFKDAGTNAKIATEVCSDEVAVYQPADRATLKAKVDACITDSGNWDNSVEHCDTVANWDVSLVTSMSTMFKNKANFNEDISAWNVSSVTNMYDMFNGATIFNQDLSAWDVSSVTNMGLMFNKAKAFNGNVSTWDVSSVTNMDNMFQICDVFNQDLSTWDVSSVVGMNGIFYNAKAFNQDISPWNISSLGHMNYMFGNAKAFNQDLSAWDISDITSLSETFWQASAFDVELCGQSWVDSTLSTTDTFSGAGSNAGIATTACTLCAIGKFKNAQDTCETCPEGKTSARAGQTICTPCDGVCPDACSSDPCGEGTCTLDGDSYNCTYTLADVTETLEVIFDDTASFDNAGQKYVFACSKNGDGDETLYVTPSSEGYSLARGSTFCGTKSSTDTTCGTCRKGFRRDYIAFDKETGKSCSGKYDGSKVMVVGVTNVLESSATNYYTYRTLDFNNGEYVINVKDQTGGGEHKWYVYYFISAHDLTSTEECDVEVSITTGTDAGPCYNNPCGEGTCTADGTDYNCTYTLADVTETLEVIFDDTASFDNAGQKYVFACSKNGDGDETLYVTPSSEGYSLARGSTFCGTKSSTDTTCGTCRKGFRRDYIAFDKETGKSCSGKYDGSKVMVVGVTNVLESSATNYYTYRTLDFNNGEYVINVKDQTGGGEHKWYVYYFISAHDLTSTEECDVEVSITTGTDAGPCYNNPCGTGNCTVDGNNYTCACGEGDIDDGTTCVTLYQPADKATLKAKVDACISDTGNWDNTVEHCDTVANWDTSLVTDMFGIFQNKANFNEDISAWDVSQATNMGSMFNNAGSFNQDISGWDVSKNTAFGGMFWGASVFNQDISSWDVSSGTSFNNMFWNAAAFNQDISSWVVSNGQYFYNMFRSTNVFNQDIGDWDVSKTTALNHMFFDAKAFNQDISDWDVSGVTKMNKMFGSAIAFNQDLSDWDVSSVTTFDGMFSGASAFDQELCGQTWLDTTADDNVETDSMFSNAGSNAKVATEACASEDATTAAASADDPLDCDGGDAYPILSMLQILLTGNLKPDYEGGACTVAGANDYYCGPADNDFCYDKTDNTGIVTVDASDDDCDWETSGDITGDKTDASALLGTSISISDGTNTRYPTKYRVSVGDYEYYYKKDTCSRRRSLANVCTNNPCGDGKCTVDGESYTCKCKFGFVNNGTTCTACAAGQVVKDNVCTTPSNFKASVVASLPKTATKKQKRKAWRDVMKPVPIAGKTKRENMARLPVTKEDLSEPQKKMMEKFKGRTPVITVATEQTESSTDIADCHYDIEQESEDEKEVLMPYGEGNYAFMCSGTTFVARQKETAEGTMIACWEDTDWGTEALIAESTICNDVSIEIGSVSTSCTATLPDCCDDCGVCDTDPTNDNLCDSQCYNASSDRATYQALGCCGC